MRDDGTALQGRTRAPFAGLLALLALSATTVASRLGDDSVETLVARLAAVETPWAERCGAEDRLSMMPAADVLPALLPHVGKGFPPGVIWNSGGREVDELAPAMWQAFYAVARVWDIQIRDLPEAGGSAILAQLLAQAPTAAAKVRVLQDIRLRSWPELEPAVATLLKDEKEPVDVRTAAAFTLMDQGKEDYHAVLLAAFEREKEHANRKAWFRCLTDPRHKARSGVDPRVVVHGFELVEVERAASPENVHGAYFLVGELGPYVGQDFMPPRSGPRYAAATGLTEAFFSDTVENARRWWREHRTEYTK